MRNLGVCAQQANFVQSAHAVHGGGGHRASERNPRATRRAPGRRPAAVWRKSKARNGPGSGSAQVRRRLISGRKPRQACTPSAKVGQLRESQTRVAACSRLAKLATCLQKSAATNDCEGGRRPAHMQASSTLKGGQRQKETAQRMSGCRQVKSAKQQTRCPNTDRRAAQSQQGSPRRCLTATWRQPTDCTPTTTDARRLALAAAATRTRSQNARCTSASCKQAVYRQRVTPI